MTIQYGTATAERMIRDTPSGLRVGFRFDNEANGTRTLFTLHPVTREIRVRTTRTGDDAHIGAGWQETHHIPPGAEYVGRCMTPSDTAPLRFEA